MLKVIGGVPDGEYKAIASGSLPNGKPVVVNSDGTVSVVSGSTISSSLGSATVFETSIGGFFAASYDSNSNRVVFSYRDDGNSSYGTAVVGTVSGTSISFGTPVVYASVNSDYHTCAFDSNSNKVVIGYNDNSASSGKAIVGTVSGTSISFGSATSFPDGNNKTYISSVFDSNSNKVVFAYKDSASSNRGKAAVATVSGTSVSFGSSATFLNTTGNGPENMCMAFDSVNNKVVLAFQDRNDSNKAKGIVGTVSGTSISFGSISEIPSSSADIAEDGMGGIAYDASSEKIVVVYRASSVSNYGRVSVGTVSGTSISFASAATFAEFNVGLSAATPKIVYDPTAQKVVVVVRAASDSQNYLYEGVVSGDTVTFSSPLAYVAASPRALSNPVYASTPEKVILGYEAQTPDNGTAAVYQTGYLSTNLTAENYIGMSSGVVEQTTVAQAAGTPVTFESALSRYTGAAYDANAQKIVIAYRDNGNSNYGTAVVGTVNASNNSISFGTPVVFEAAEVAFTTITYDANAQKVVITYEDQGNSQYGTAVVGTVSGTSISFGTPVVFNSGAVDEMSSTYDANAQKVVISYSDQSQNYGEAVVGTVSGTSISFGTPVAYKTNAIGSNSITYDSTNQKVVIVFRNSGGDLNGKAVVGTVSGTSISFGSEVTFSTQSPEYLSVIYDSNNQKIVIAYTASSNSSYGTAIVGTVSGTGISFGSASVFNTSTTAYNSIGYDATAQRVVISYRDSGNSLYGTAVAGEVSGSSITFNTPTVFQTGRTQEIGTAYDTNAEKIVLSYWDYAASTGDAVVFQAGYTATDRYPVADGDPARLDIIGSVSDNQLSLTAGEKYYVQTDGTISTTAGSPSVLAGTAISATKLVVKT